MTAFGWQRQKSLRDWLFEEPWGFNFFQAMRILELLRLDGPRSGEGASPASEPVRLRSSPSLAFPASEIQDVKPGNPPEMTVNFFGLTGPQGPLPLPDTERLLDRIAYKDTAFRDFLDIFNHRLLTLVYRVRKIHRPPLTPSAPDQTAVGSFLYAAVGLGLPQLRGRMEVSDSALLFYAGMLSHHPRNASGLERMLGDYFGLPVELRQLQGRWRPLGEDQQMRIGRSGANQVLGESAVVGTRFWDQQAKFEVVLGPMPFTAFTDLLPDGRGYRAMCQLVRFHAGLQYEFSFRLVLMAREVPGTRLGQTKLGWTSWVVTGTPHAADDQVRLRPARAD